MAVPRGTRFEVEHDQVFVDGAAVVGPVSADLEYVSNEDRARGKQPKRGLMATVGELGLLDLGSLNRPISAQEVPKIPAEQD
jgi:hypothetical protein